MYNEFNDCRQYVMDELLDVDMRGKSDKELYLAVLHLVAKYAETKGISREHQTFDETQRMLDEWTQSIVSDLKNGQEESESEDIVKVIKSELKKNQKDRRNVKFRVGNREFEGIPYAEFSGGKIIFKMKDGTKTFDLSKIS